MFAPYLPAVQIHEQSHHLSEAQQDAAAAQITGLLRTLGITNFHVSQTNTQQLYTSYDQHIRPSISTPKSVAQPCPKSFSSSKECLELDTTNPQYTVPPADPLTTTSPSTSQSNFHNNVHLPKLWPPDEQIRETHLMRAFDICLTNLRELATNLDLIQKEVHFTNHGRAPRASGGTYRQKQPSHDSNGAQTDSALVSGQAMGNGSFPPFMNDWLPVPDPSPDPEDVPGTKRCTVGRPLGKILRPGQQFHGLGRCDKHHNKGVFETNMQVRRSAEGDYRLREHAWKCSGQGTPSAPKDKSHRL